MKKEEIIYIEKKDIPEVTPEKPYIEFRIDSNFSNIQLTAVDNWWGGKYAGFDSTNGTTGNTCKPNQLNEYINVFVNRKIKSIERKISILKSQLKIVKTNSFNLINNL